VFNRFLFGLLAFVAVLAAADISGAQTPLEVIQKRDMKFGNWASDKDAPGTVTISPNADSASFTGAVVAFGGTIKRARFQITGEPKAYVWVTLPSSITIHKGTSGRTMTVDSFTMDKTNPIRLNNSGNRTINIGATLHVDANQRKGNYNDDNEFFVSAVYF
jgi:hypothetical protein